MKYTRYSKKQDFLYHTEEWQRRKSGHFVGMSESGNREMYEINQKLLSFWYGYFVPNQPYVWNKAMPSKEKGITCMGGNSAKIISWPGTQHFFSWPRSIINLVNISWCFTKVCFTVIIPLLAVKFSVAVSPIYNQCPAVFCGILIGDYLFYHRLLIPFFATQVNFESKIFYNKTNINYGTLLL